LPFSFALNSAANESNNPDGMTGDRGPVGEFSSLHSDSRVLVPVSLPSDESNRRSWDSKRLDDGCRSGIGFGGGSVTSSGTPNLEKIN
jgi:hypothetical protein